MLPGAARTVPTLTSELHAGPLLAKQDSELTAKASLAMCCFRLMLWSPGPEPWSAGSLLLCRGFFPCQSDIWGASLKSPEPPQAEERLPAGPRRRGQQERGCGQKSGCGDSLFLSQNPVVLCTKKGCLAEKSGAARQALDTLSLLSLGCL